MVIIATLSNCNDWEEIYCFAITHKKWLKGFLKLTGGIPTPQTYERVISIIDENELNNLCVEFMYRLIEIPINPQYDFYHFDGKVEKGRGRKTDKKNNEITAIPEVIKRLNIKGVICTWDALNTQKNTVEAVIRGKGDYEGAYKKEIEKSHSQIITKEEYKCSLKK